MIYTLNNGGYAVIKASDFWATLEIYDSNGNLVERLMSESVFRLEDALCERGLI